MHWEAIVNLILPMGAAMALSFLLCGKIRKYAVRNGIVDDPKSDARKTHKTPTPLLGGIGIILSIFLVLAMIMQFAPQMIGAPLAASLMWVALAVLVIMVGGALDDSYALPAYVQILFPAFAACIVIYGGGITIHEITNPLGGKMVVGASGILTFVWLMVMTYTTKLLDGLDGLATGIGAIGAMMIALLALTVAYFQPDIALVAFVFFGALIGFLAWNFNPAQMFLGEVGSEFIGFFLGVLSVISGGKIATALLVVVIPMLDIAHVMYMRLREGRSIFSGDRHHLHFLLAERYGVRKTVWGLYALSASFGLVTLSLQQETKEIALMIAAGVAIILMVYTKKRPGA